MRFYQDNRVDKETKVHPENILDEYLKSEQFKNWQKGTNFDRGLRIFLTDTYGTFDEADYKLLGDYIWRNWENRLKALAIINSVCRGK